MAIFSKGSGAGVRAGLRGRDFRTDSGMVMAEWAATTGSSAVRRMARMVAVGVDKGSLWAQRAATILISRLSGLREVVNPVIRVIRLSY